MEEHMSVTEEIRRLKNEKNAVILAHYYVPDEVQAIADHIGDSYYLSKAAKETQADIIVFCGVRFMGESAAILNPDKKVLMPDMDADCAMAHMVNLDKIAEMRNLYDDLAVVCYINSAILNPDKKVLMPDMDADCAMAHMVNLDKIAEMRNLYDDLAVVCYINSTAEIKTYSDVCVTSANAVKIVRNLPNQNIFFIPDGNLGRYVAEQVPEKNVVLNDGYCPVHAALTAEDVKNAKKLYPKAKFLVHPECTKDLLDEADYIGSTSGIIQFVDRDDEDEYIIGTESGVFYELKKRNPDKKFYTLTPKQICTDMKFVTLEKVLDVLQHETNEITVTEDMRQRALIPLENMLALAK